MSVMWLNEVTDFSIIGLGVTKECWPDFRDAWHIDFEEMTNKDSKFDAIEIANAYLMYYGGIHRVIDIGWDPLANCFIWKVVNNTLGTIEWE